MVDYFYKKLTPRLGYGNVLLQYQDTGEHSPPLFFNNVFPLQIHLS